MKVVSSVDNFNAACFGEKVVYSCTTRGTTTMSWISQTFIGSSNDALQFNTQLKQVGDGLKSMLSSGECTFAQMIEADNNIIVSELRVVMPQNSTTSELEVFVTCRNDDDGEIDTISTDIAGTNWVQDILIIIILAEKLTTATVVLHPLSSDVS